jgi:PAS domain S-box-containing protein
MNEAIKTVKKTWYRIYGVIMLTFTVLVAIGSLAVELTPSLQEFGETYALNGTALVLAGVNIAYSVSLYWVVQRKNPTLATLVCSMLFSLVLLQGLSQTDPGSGAWVYVGGWIVTALFVSMYGPVFILGTVLLAVIYVLLNTDFLEQDLSNASIALLVGNVLASFSYLFWRKQFTEESDVQIKQLSGQLKSNQSQSAILVQSIADGVIVTSTEGKITLMNRAAANLTGWTVEEANGLDIKLVFKVTKEKGEVIADAEFPFTAVLQHKAFFNQTLQLEARNGQKRIISLVISPVVTASGEVYGTVAVLRDVSEAKAAETQRAEFISTASHEMRTPVAAIEGYLALSMNEKVSTIDSRARGYLDKAYASTRHLGQLFQDLLTSAKAEDGRLSSHPSVVEMGAFLEQLIEDLKFGAQKKSLAVEFAVGSSDSIDARPEAAGGRMVKPLYYAYADPERMREVITNLFDNAVKYTDQGKISVGLTGNEQVVQFFIRDTGAGIPADDVPHLFQKFYRVDNSATRTIGGTGLGLFIARKIIELYNGRIWVESEVGKGSTFFINLPRLSSQQADSMGAATATPIPAAPAPQA